MKKQGANILDREEVITQTVAKLKAKYGKIHVLRIVVEEETVPGKKSGEFDINILDEAVAYLKEPDRAIYGVFLGGLENNLVLSCETLLRDCMITPDSDKRVIDDFDIFMSAIPQLTTLVKQKKSSLKTY